MWWDEEDSGTVKKPGPQADAWWLAWFLIGITFFFAVAYGFGW